MTIFGKPLSEYVSFAKVILLLILIVGVARLGLSLAGVKGDGTIVVIPGAKHAAHDEGENEQDRDVLANVSEVL